MRAKKKKPKKIKTQNLLHTKQDERASGLKGNKAMIGRASEEAHDKTNSSSWFLTTCSDTVFWRTSPDWSQDSDFGIFLAQFCTTQCLPSFPDHLSDRTEQSSSYSLEKPPSCFLRKWNKVLQRDTFLFIIYEDCRIIDRPASHPVKPQATFCKSCHLSRLRSGSGRCPTLSGVTGMLFCLFLTTLRRLCFFMLLFSPILQRHPSFLFHRQSRDTTTLWFMN